MVTGSVTGGNGVAGVIVNGPVPVILKLITSGTLVVPFAVSIACLNDPAPVSLVLVTEMVAHLADPQVMAKTNSAQPVNNASQHGMDILSGRVEAQYLIYFRFKRIKTLSANE